MNRSLKVWINALALVMVLGLVSRVMADDAPAADATPVKGVVVSVAADGTSLVINTGTKKAPVQVTVACDANTTVTVDGAAAKLSDLTAGEHVSITPATGTAKTITAKSGQKKKAAGQ
jgi:hypothetical protein